MVRRVHNEFDGTPESVHATRTFVRVALAVWGLPRLGEPAVLLTSEVATNALVHARTGWSVTLEWDGADLLVEVADGSPASPLRRTPTAMSEQGRGLVLVDSLADRWGTRLEAGAKTVWFVLRAGAGRIPGRAA